MSSARIAGPLLALSSCLLPMLPVSAHVAAVSHYPASFFTAAHPNTAYDMVERLPGFAFDDGTNARGFAGTAGNVLIDGQRPTAKTDDLESILKRIPASEVERIDLIRGNATGIDMHGHTVIADVIRRTTASTAIIASASADFWPDGHTVHDLKLEYTHTNGLWRYEASIERVPNFDDSVGTGSNILIDAAGQRDLQHVAYTNATEGWTINGAVTMPLLQGALRTNLTLLESPGQSLITYSSPGYLQHVSDENDQRSAEFGSHWTRQWQDLDVNMLILQRLGHYTEINASLAPGSDQSFATTQNTGESIARTTLRYDVPGNIAIEGGGEAVYNFLNGRSSYNDNGVAIPVPGADAQVSEQRGEVFAQATWKFAPNWSLLAGTRFEFSTISESGGTHQRRSFSYPKPIAVLSWTPDRNDQIRLRVERLVGQLDFTNFIASSDLQTSGVHAGNALLRPDQHTQYEIFYERQFGKKGAISIGLMHDDLKDVVDRIPIYASGGIFDAPGNLANGQANEIDVNGTLPLAWLGISGGSLRLKSTFHFSSVRDPITGQMRRISGERPYTIQASFAQDMPQWHSTWGIDFDAVWDEYYYRVQSFEHRYVTPPYLQVYWQYMPSPAWSFRAEVDNAVPFSYLQEVITYQGLRGASPVAQVANLDIHSQPRLLLQIRRTFG